MCLNYLGTFFKTWDNKCTRRQTQFLHSIFFSLTKPQSFADCVGDELPVGWEQVLDYNRGVYYVNHVESKLTKQKSLKNFLLNIFRASSSWGSSSGMASPAGGHVKAVPGHCQGGSSSQDGARDHQAGQVEPRPGRVQPSEHNTLRAVKLNNKL